MASAQPTTVAALDSIPSPLPKNTTQNINTRLPGETNQWTVKATLVAFRQEGDSDFHLVLKDGSAQMIAEIPAPACMGQSPWVSQVATARNAFVTKVGRPPQASANQGFQQVNLPVTVTGVEFFDFPHGQSGLAPNAIELHPVLAISFP